MNQRRASVVDDTPANVKLSPTLPPPRRVATAASGAEALASIRESPPDLVPRLVIAGHERLRGLPGDSGRTPRPPSSPVVLVLPSTARGARQGLEARRRDFLPSPSTRRSWSRACARCCASSSCTTRSALRPPSSRMEQDPRAARLRAGRANRPPRTPEALFLPQARGAHRVREATIHSSPTGAGVGGVPRSARLYRVHRERSARR